MEVLEVADTGGMKQLSPSNNSGSATKCSTKIQPPLEQSQTSSTPVK